MPDSIIINNTEPTGSYMVLTNTFSGLTIPSGATVKLKAVFTVGSGTFQSNVPDSDVFTQIDHP